MVEETFQQANESLPLEDKVVEEALFTFTVADAVHKVVYCDVIERNCIAMSRHRHNIASRHYDGSRRCCYSGVN
jgi:hypothetical protein